MRHGGLTVLFALTMSCSRGGDATSADELSDAARFDKDLRKKPCELLTPSIVAQTFAVPKSELEQREIMGCIYTWENDADTLEASLMMPRAHQSEQVAARWFKNATASKTAEEMKAAMEDIKTRVEKRKELDTDAKKKTARGLLDSIGTEAVTYEDVPGVPEEARMSNDGSVYVRVDNLTFTVKAYKGAKQPPPEFKVKKPKAMIAAAKEHARKWAVETAPQRKKDGVTLAKAVATSL